MCFTVPVITCCGRGGLVKSRPQLLLCTASHVRRNNSFFSPIGRLLESGVHRRQVRLLAESLQLTGSMLTREMFGSVEGSKFCIGDIDENPPQTRRALPRRLSPHKRGLLWHEELGCPHTSDASKAATTTL